VNKKYEKADKAIRMMARINKTELDAEFDVRDVKIEVCTSSQKERRRCL